MPADQNQKSIWAVFGALFLALWLAAIDQTVVSTALPTMVAELEIGRASCRERVSDTV